MSVQTHYLSNGIPVYIKNIPTSFKVCLDITVQTGSIHDPAGREGLAHFLEHMMFRGTNRRSYRQISVDALKLGGYLNAFTERDATTYTLDVPYRQVTTAIDILLDVFLEPQFPQEGIEKERTIILEEIDMYNDIPGEFLMDQFIEAIYPDKLGHPILGTRASVQAITRQDVIHFFEQHYFNSPLVISVSGRVDAADILQELEKRMGQRKSGTIEQGKSAPLVNKKQAVRFHREVDQAQLILGVAAPGLEDQDRLAIQVMNAILGGNEISRLYQMIREERGLAYSVEASHDAWLGAGVYYVSVGLDSQKMKDIESLILEEWEKMKSTLVTDEELEIARNSLEGAKIMELEGAGSYNSFISSMAVRGLSIDPEEELNCLHQISKEDIQRVANRLLDTNQYTITALLPKRSTGRRHR
jgi:predicted Zn-dependent peptidase